MGIKQDGAYRCGSASMPSPGATRTIWATRSVAQCIQTNSELDPVELNQAERSEAPPREARRRAKRGLRRRRLAPEAPPSFARAANES